jgi:hypothetical protein
VPEALYAYNNSTRRSSSRRNKRDRADDAIDVDDMSDDDDSDADDHSDQGLDHDRLEWTACEVSESPLLNSMPYHLHAYLIVCYLLVASARVIYFVRSRLFVSIRSFKLYATVKVMHALDRHHCNSAIRRCTV